MTGNPADHGDYCYDCHGDGSDEGHLELDSYANIDEMIADRAEWKRIRDHIDFRLMPPPDEYAPGEEERAKMVKWIDYAVFYVDPKNPDPGHVTLRRLNRTEYENTIRDLLGVNAEVTEILPVDDSGYGFDNIADVLTLSPLHMERYLEAADVALDMAVDFSPPKFPEKLNPGAELEGAGVPSGSALMLATTGEALPRVGEFPKFTITARADEAGDEAAKMELKINGEKVKIWEVASRKKEPNIEPKSHWSEQRNIKFTVGFLNDYYNESHPEGKRDRNLLVECIAIEGPIEGEPLTRRLAPRNFLREEAGQSDENYMIAVMRKFIAKAFRRPVKEGEAERYLVFLENAKAQEKSVDYAIRQALAAVLVSPSFLFREEPGIGEISGRKGTN